MINISVTFIISFREKKKKRENLAFSEYMREITDIPEANLRRGKKKCIGRQLLAKGKKGKDFSLLAAWISTVSCSLWAVLCCGVFQI